MPSAFQTLLAALLGLSIGAGSAKSVFAQNWTRYEFTQAEMGIPFHMALYGANDASAERAARAAFRRVKELNAIMSDYDPDSELSQLSARAGSAQPIRVSDDLWTVLEEAQWMARQSDGAFDITVGPLVQVWRQARRRRALPSASVIAAAKARVGYEDLVLDPARHTAWLRRPGMRLDLGGIAKGYALDQALRVLKTDGFPRSFVAAGGDMAFGDPPPEETGWRIEIPPLDAPGAPGKRFIRISRMGLATSGDFFQKLVIAGRRYSHIVDPQTGIGLTDHSLVTVIATNAITADAFSTAVSVMGPEKALALARQVPRTEVHVVRDPSGTVQEFQSSGFRSYFETPRR